jgi:hypothetical protein
MKSCSYCGSFFGDVVWYEGKQVVVKKHRDHVIPRSYCNHDNSSNKLPACQICNQWKSDKIFDSWYELQQYIFAKWEKATCQKNNYRKKRARIKLVRKRTSLKKPGKSSAPRTAVTNTTGTLVQSVEIPVSVPTVDLFTSSTQLIHPTNEQEQINKPIICELYTTVINNDAKEKSASIKQTTTAHDNETLVISEKSSVAAQIVDLFTCSAQQIKELSTRAFNKQLAKFAISILPRLSPTDLQRLINEQEADAKPKRISSPLRNRQCESCFVFYSPTHRWQRFCSLPCFLIRYKDETNYKFYY